MPRTLSTLLVIACALVAVDARAAMVTSTTITAVETEPSAPWTLAFVDVHVAADAGTPTNGSVVEVHGGDGSYSSCQLGSGGLAFCPVSFAASGTVMLTASYLGDGVEEELLCRCVAQGVLQPEGGHVFFGAGCAAGA